MVQQQTEPAFVFKFDVGLDVDRVDLPGGVLGTGFRCPNCSMIYTNFDHEHQKELKIPTECERCGCSMDKELAKDFADEQARSSPTARLGVVNAATSTAKENAQAEEIEQLQAELAEARNGGGKN
jgi:peptide subunit release factor 1 (eRF1)